MQRFLNADDSYVNDKFTNKSHIKEIILKTRYKHITNTSTKRTYCVDEAVSKL